MSQVNYHGGGKLLTKLNSSSNLKRDRDAAAATLSMHLLYEEGAGLSYCFKINEQTDILPIVQ